jgi:hypothetical protein
LTILVHEVLELLVSAFLELDVVLETWWDHRVYFLFEIKESLRQLNLVALQRGVIVDPASNFFDVSLHALDHSDQALRIPFEAPIEEFQIVSPVVWDHVEAAVLFLDYLLMMVADYFFFDALHVLWFCIGMKKFFTELFFVQKVVFCYL